MKSKANTPGKVPVVPLASPEPYTDNYHLSSHNFYRVLEQLPVRTVAELHFVHVSLSLEINETEQPV